MIERYRAFKREVGPEGDAMRSVLGKIMPSGEPLKHRYQGWWPRSKVLHHLKLKWNRLGYSSAQITRAYYRLPREERVEWYWADRMNRVAFEREEMMRTDPWGLALRDMERWPSVMEKLLELTDETEKEAS